MNLRSILSESRDFSRTLEDYFEYVYDDIRDSIEDLEDGMTLAIRPFEHIKIEMSNYRPGSYDIEISMNIPFGYFDFDNDTVDIRTKVDNKYSAPYISKIVNDIKKYLKAKSASFKISGNVAKAQFILK